MSGSELGEKVELLGGDRNFVRMVEVGWHDGLGIGRGETCGTDIDHQPASGRRLEENWFRLNLGLWHFCGDDAVGWKTAI